MSVRLLYGRLNPPASLMAFDKVTRVASGEYAAHVEDAKREATRQERLESIMPVIRAGKGLRNAPAITFSQ